MYESTPELKAALIEQIRDPAYRRDVERLAEAMMFWQETHPGEKAEWIDPGRVLVAGGALDSVEARSFLAGNDAAHRCLIWVDEKTGKKMTVMMATFALAIVGQRERSSPCGAK